MRKDDFSLGVMDHFKNKQDDLADTICQIEAICVCWGFQLTQEKIETPKILNCNVPKIAIIDTNNKLVLNCNTPKTTEKLVLNCNIPKTIDNGSNLIKYSKEHIMSLSRVIDVKNIILENKLDLKSGGTIAISKIRLSNLDDYKKIVIDKLYPS